METDIFLIKSPNLEIYQTDDLRKWIGIYLHACRSRNLAAGTIEFYGKKLNAFVRFCSEHAVTNVSQIGADHIRQFLISLLLSFHQNLFEVV
jgi:site-specific recombinase XerD